jgi:uncharacterized membrane-anchored protein YitT (DUF2179 family)/predicted metal-dependent HD superfamily phosphohydrolase
MQYDPLHSYLIQKLENGLPAYLTYHNAAHTSSVIEAAEHLAAAENIVEEDLILLKTAALFHDAGYLKHHEEHEALSCDLARKLLPDYGYSSDQTEKVCRMIMATKLPHAPVDLLGEILCDADLYYLGTDHYSFYTEKLFQEFKKFGLVKTKIEWELHQKEFLTNHKFYTQTAIREREGQKRKQLQLLKSKLESSISSSKEMNLIVIIKDILLMLVGVVFAGYALKGFLVPNHFFDGGVTGISLLVHELYGFNLGVVILILNLPFIIVSYFSIGNRFAFRMLIGVIMLGCCLALLPDVAVTQDKLLIAIFGGVFLGIGVGLVMRAGSSLDGIEVLAIYTFKRTSFTITEIILGINIMIFSVAAFKFGIETALYSMLTYFCATRSIDYVVEGIQAHTGVTIISGKSEIIKYQLVNTLGRGITVYKGERGFLPGKYEISADCDIIFTVISRLELRKLKNLVYELDPNAFVYVNPIKEASGGILRRRHHH